MRSAPILMTLLAFGSAVFFTSTSAMALPIPQDAGVSASSIALQARYGRGHRAYRRTPQRVMGLVPGPDRRRGRIIRLPR